MPLHYDLIRQFGVSESLGTCPNCCKAVETGDRFHRESIQNGHSDDPAELFNGIAYVHDTCDKRDKT